MARSSSYGKCWTEGTKFQSKERNKAHGGETMSLDDARGKNGTIVVFECNHCPYVIASIGRMEDMVIFAKQSNIGL